MFHFLKKFAKGISNSCFELGSRIRSLFSKEIDASTLQELEQLFYEADLGVTLSSQLVDQIRSAHRKNPDLKTDEILDLIREHLLSLLKPPQETSLAHPHVVLMVGVNGSGKTTSVAKLAVAHQKAGRKVLIAACDTFRAAASEQLEKWALSLGVQIVKSQANCDPAAVAFDALAAAKARNCDLVLIDTAGRLQTKTELMHELSKIYRICQKQIPNAPHEVLLVIDATIGQNAIDQAALFHKFTPLTGIVLTKLDGSAKGGVALALQTQTAIPIRWIGIGEGATDFESFDARTFVDALLGTKK